MGSGRFVKAIDSIQSRLDLTGFDLSGTPTQIFHITHYGASNLLLRKSKGNISSVLSIPVTIPIETKTPRLECFE